MSNFFGKLIIGKRESIPPKCSKVSGIVYLSGSTPQASAIVDCFDENNQSFVGEVTTDAGGNFTFGSGFAIRDDHKFSVVARYDSGSQKYNSLSQPYITPVAN